MALGHWAKDYLGPKEAGGGGSGGNDFVVSFTFDEGLVCDKTYEEILAAAQAKKNIYGWYDQSQMGDNGYYYSYCRFLDIDEYGGAKFSYQSYGDQTTLYIGFITISNNNAKDEKHCRITMAALS